MCGGQQAERLQCAVCSTVPEAESYSESTLYVQRTQRVVRWDEKRVRVAAATATATVTVTDPAGTMETVN